MFVWSDATATRRSRAQNNCDEPDVTLLVELSPLPHPFGPYKNISGFCSYYQDLWGDV